MYTQSNVEDPRGRSMHKNERLILTSLTFTDDYRRAENLNTLPLLILPRLMQKKKKIPKCFQHLSKRFWRGSSSTFGQVEREEKNAVHCFLKPKVIPVNKNTP